ncbi:MULTISPECIES: hypothetical protein [Acinetobacter]|uniref:DUF4238 domain-containing protein n=1 Tax=Acinetobacter towneri TaxID=202956 RepID=A0AB35M496_9GAMM|nr:MULTISPECIES: hypothetical protein [Acinetobacter]MDM1720110.1 hypothetical protein [Acinetobacter towneri]MDM1732177.1 hypothetical protein [Acinetobacter towneri]MDM1734892.1 hypothetical protein [Acinetobacter towneri]MDM1740126.1 hypothetical protein [Acinetobacter towneri]MDM1742625.1 hypothetical protein [Acinetobacter towneri]
MHGSDHEIVQLFKRQQYPLSETLTEMLNEHFSHQTERRGCGFTQATRVLAEFINVARAPHELNDFKLFRDYEDQTLKNLLKERKLSDWHNLDQNIETTTLIQKNKPESTADLIKHIQFQAQLRQLAQQAQQEESKLLVQMIADIILPKSSAQTGLVELPVLAEKPKVGSCPMAENFFLKIAHGRILRKGSVNIIVNQHNQPLLLEKLNMGDDHSCISLKPLLMNGVCLPAGSLFSVDYDSSTIQNKTANQNLPGFVIPYSEIPGFWYLRLTTLAISPENRARTFSTHFQQQIANGLFSPETTLLQQLADIASAQIRS